MTRPRHDELLKEAEICLSWLQNVAWNLPGASLRILKLGEAILKAKGENEREKEKFTPKRSDFDGIEL